MQHASQHGPLRCSTWLMLRLISILSSVQQLRQG
jgi:hypothetical protein